MHQPHHQRVEYFYKEKKRMEREREKKKKSRVIQPILSSFASCFLPYFFVCALYKRPSLFSLANQSPRHICFIGSIIFLSFFFCLFYRFSCPLCNFRALSVFLPWKKLTTRSCYSYKYTHLPSLSPSTQTTTPPSSHPLLLLL